VGVRRDPLGPRTIGNRTRSAAQHLVGHRGQQRLLVREVPVEGAGLDTEVGGQAPHGEVGQPVPVEDLERVLDDVGSVMAHRGSGSAGAVACQNT
jgi:hypothetical protein